jgi:hypothetical protein
VLTLQSLLVPLLSAYLFLTATSTRTQKQLSTSATDQLLQLVMLPLVLLPLVLQLQLLQLQTGKR